MTKKIPCAAFLLLTLGVLEPGVAQSPAAPPGSAWVGCYKDTNDFDLDGFLEAGAANTPQRCVETCRRLGYRYAGLQDAQSCLCGDSYGRYGQASNCNLPCTGDPRQICGGFSANSVYRIDSERSSSSGPPTSGSSATAPALRPNADALDYLGIRPGVSTRAEAESVLGAPRRSVGQLSQHVREDGTRVFIRTGAGDVVEQVDVLPPAPVEPGRVRAELRLGPPDFSRVNPEGQLEEGFRAAQLLLTHDGAGASDPVERIGYFDAALFAVIEPAPGSGDDR